MTYPIDNTIPASGNPGLDGNVKMGGGIAPSDYNDMAYGFTTHRDLLGKGGYMAGKDIASRDALHESSRSFGMLYSTIDGKTYKLCNIAMGGIDNDINNNTNRIEVNSDNIKNNSAIPGQTVSEALNNLDSALIRQRKVIDIVDGTTPPPTEVVGDRYILNGNTPVDAGWDGASANDIVEFDGITWNVTTPQEGYVSYVDNLNNDALFVDDGTPSWEIIATRTTTIIAGLGSDQVVPTEKAVVDYMPNVSHNTLSNKQGGTTGGYYHYRIAANLAGLGSGTVVGELGLTEGDEKAYKWSGSTWILIGGIGYVPTPGDLPVSASLGDTKIALSNSTLYIYNGTIWTREGQDLSSLTNYLGTWNATTNTPTIVSGVGSQGDYYKVSVAGTTNIDGNDVWGVNDIIWFDAQTMVWNKIDNQSATTVRSLYAKTAASGNISVTSPSTATITGYTLSIGDSVLLPSQTVSSQNGLYIFKGVGVPMMRSPQFITADDILGSTIRITGGSYGGRKYACTNTTYTTPGASSIAFERYFSHFNRTTTSIANTTLSQSQARFHSIVLYITDTTAKEYVLGAAGTYQNYTTTVTKLISTGVDNDLPVTIKGTVSGLVDIQLRRDRDSITFTSTGSSFRLVHRNISTPSINEAKNIAVLAGVDTDVTIYNIKDVMPSLQATISSTGEVVQIGMQKINNTTIRLTSDVNITVDLQYITLAL